MEYKLEIVGTDDPFVILEEYPILKKYNCSVKEFEVNRICNLTQINVKSIYNFLFITIDSLEELYELKKDLQNPLILDDVEFNNMKFNQITIYDDYLE